MPHPAFLLVLIRIVLLLSSTALFLLAASGRVLDLWTSRSPRSNFRGGDPCLAYSTCASCAGARYYGRAASPLNFWPFDSRPECRWCPSTRTCSPVSSEGTCSGAASSQGAGGYVTSQYYCPLYPAQYPVDEHGEDIPPDFLPDWMGALLDGTDGRFGEMALLDMSLPGTHDSMSYDLTGTVSDEAADGVGVREWVEWLHWLSGGTVRLMPGEIEEFLRLQAKTQHLSLLRQLDNGIRFLDFRISLEWSTRIWHCLHFLQSAHPVAHYLRLLRAWLDEHPREVVALWLSREGNTGATGEGQYPFATTEEKLDLWGEVETIFDGVLLDGRASSIGRTPLRELVRRNHRLIVFASDYAEFTNSSRYAVDAAKIDNFWRGDAVFNEPATLAAQREYFSGAAERNAAVRERGNGDGFTLMSMNTAGQGWQLEGAARERFLPWPLDRWFNTCSSRLGASIPGGDGTWCPETLLDVAQLSNYYDQIAVEEAFLKSAAAVHEVGWAFPHAFYLDALDYGGVLRTGPMPLFGRARGGDDLAVNGTKAYGYVHTVIAYNVRSACALGPLRAGREHGEEGGGPVATYSSGSVSWPGRPLPQRIERRGLRLHTNGISPEETGGCQNLLADMERRRAAHPLALWRDDKYGRRDDWPA